MPRFSLKDLLIGTTLCGAGLAAVCGIPRLPRSGPFEELWNFVAVLFWFGGGALIGVGLLIPFKRMWFGAVIGLVVQIVLFAILCVVTASQFK